MLMKTNVYVNHCKTKKCHPKGFRTWGNNLSILHIQGFPRNFNQMMIMGERDLIKDYPRVCIKINYGITTKKYLMIELNDV